MSSIYDADTDEFEVEEVVEESDDDGDDDGDECSSSESPLTSNGIGRVFIVSTARTAGGHRPSCTFEGDLYDVCVSPDTGGAYLQRVLQTDDPSPLALSLRYEPPSPKFSKMHPLLASYRVKLLQGSQFIYLHRGLPKVCVVDRQARCLVWGQLQLVMRDTPQLNAVLAVLRHADVQHMSVWPPQVSMLWLGPPGAGPWGAFDQERVEEVKRAHQEGFLPRGVWQQFETPIRANGYYVMAAVAIAVVATGLAWRIYARQR